MLDANSNSGRMGEANIEKTITPDITQQNTALDPEHADVLGVIYPCVMAVRVVRHVSILTGRGRNLQGPIQCEANDVHNCMVRSDCMTFRRRTGGSRTY